MTLRLLLLNSVIVVGLIGALGGFGGCTDKEQEARVARQQRIEKEEAREAQEKKEQEAEQAMQKAHEEQQAVENPPVPEASPEPEKVTNYVFHNTICKCSQNDPCGASFWRCKDGKAYTCFHDVVYSTIDVDKTDDNDGSCN
jgi:hypothetical protein